MRRRLLGDDVRCGLETGDGYILATSDAITVLEHDTPEPAWERVRLAQRRQGAVGVEESLLRGVLGQVVVAEDRRRIGNGDVLKHANELCERTLIAGVRGADRVRDSFSVGIAGQMGGSSRRVN